MVEQNYEPINHKSRRVAIARVEAILDTHKSGITDSASLQNAARMAEKEVNDKRGQESEKRFLTIAPHLSIVKEVRKGSINDDLKGIDAWIKLIEKEGLGQMPVQIKSSDKAVERFMRSNNFYQLNGCIFCLNCNWRVNEKNLLNQIRGEAARIRNIYASKKI